MKKMLLAVAALTLLFACSKDAEMIDQQPLNPSTKAGEYLDVNRTSIYINDGYGDTVFVDINSNMNWSVTSKPSFCYLPVTSGNGSHSLRIQVWPNSTGTQRTENLVITGTLSGQTIVKTIPITQVSRYLCNIFVSTAFGGITASASMAVRSKVTVKFNVVYLINGREYTDRILYIEPYNLISNTMRPVYEGPVRLTITEVSPGEDYYYIYRAVNSTN